MPNNILFCFGVMKKWLVQTEEGNVPQTYDSKEPVPGCTLQLIELWNTEEPGNSYGLGEHACFNESFE